MVIEVSCFLVPLDDEKDIFIVGRSMRFVRNATGLLQSLLPYLPQQVQEPVSVSIDDGVSSDNREGHVSSLSGDDARPVDQCLRPASRIRGMTFSLKYSSSSA